MMIDVCGVCTVYENMPLFVIEPGLFLVTDIYSMCIWCSIVYVSCASGCKQEATVVRECVYVCESINALCLW